MRPTFVRALAVSVGLSALFLAVYSGCNWITARRGDVGTIYFAWERHIPYVPLMVLPYLSIDLFFVTAPFLCRSQRELSAFAKRIAAAIVVAGTCFLLFPRRFAFDRPQADGWLGAAFDWFRGMDLPYNLFPSLHIALGSLLVVTYARHTRGVIRVLVCGWFILIAASAVLTWQHHILDVVGGLALAGYCFYFIRETPAELPVVPDRADWLALSRGRDRARRSRGIVFWPWGALLLWPALSLALVAAAYFQRRPGDFSQSGWRRSLEHLLGARAMPARATSVASLLSERMPRVGSGHAECLDRAGAERT